VNALSKMSDAAAPGGLILDLQVIRPDPYVELDGEVVARIDGEPLFEWADAATAAIETRIAAGDLVEEAIDDHDVRKHYSNGADLVEDVAGSKRRLPEEAVPVLGRIARPLVVRERCRVRRLRVTWAQRVTLVAEDGGGLLADPFPERRRAREPGVADQVALVEVAGLGANRADE
jgi:hypothetical protein